MRIKFIKDYDYTPSGERRVTIAFKAGMTETVKREAGEAAIAAGAGVEVKPFNGAPLDKCSASAPLAQIWGCG
nr:hypothetical protein [Brevundimonas diminuta]